MLNVSRTMTGFVGNYETQDVTLIFQLGKLTERDLHIVGHLRIRAHTLQGEYQLYSGLFNVTSSDSRNKLATHLKKLDVIFAKDLPWLTLLESFAGKVLDLYTAPAQALRFVPVENPHTRFLLYPLLPERHVSIIYAPGGAGKSMFAMYVAILVQNGYDFDANKTEPKEVLYVDWEMDYNEMNRRYNMIVPPDGIEKQISPLYYEATLTFKDEFETLAQLVEENNISLMIIDSAALACGGDIIDASKVADFFLGLKLFLKKNVTVLVISHISKAAKERDDGSTPIGSIFFENFARSTWEMRYQVLPQRNDAFIYALFNRKSNFGKLKPIAITITFDKDTAFIERANPFSIGITGNTQEDVILHCLAMERTLTTDELAKMTGFKKESLWVVLSNLKKKGLIEQVERGKWRVIENPNKKQEA